MKRWFKLVLVLLLIPFNVIFSQDEEFKQQIKAQLNNKNKKDVEKAETYYKSAANEMKLADEAESGSKKKALKLRISASKDLARANKMIYRIYKQDLAQFFNKIDPLKAKKAEQKMDRAELMMKEAKKKREASLRLNVLESVYELMDKANKYESLAIKDLTDVYRMIIGMSQVVGKETVLNLNSNNEKPDNENKNVRTEENNSNIDNVVDENKEEKITEDKNIKTTVINKEQIKIHGSEGVFFLIQVAASKSPISDESLKQSYKEDLHGEKFGEWYKYFVNKKFSSLVGVNEYRANMNIRGTFVVAYKNGRKVSVQEAMKKEVKRTEVIIENKTAVEPTEETKTVYRLEIGISTKPLSAAEVGRFKNGGKAVISVDRGGWYSYTIGNFRTETEALNFKRIRGLADAVVLKFRNGKVED